MSRFIDEIKELNKQIEYNFKYEINEAIKNNDFKKLNNLTINYTQLTINKINKYNYKKAKENESNRIK